MAVGETTYAPRAHDYIIDIYLPTDAPVVVHREIALARPVEELPADAEVIGRVDTRGAPLADWSSLLRDAQDKARQLGGDAIVVRQWDNPYVGTDGNGVAQYGKALSIEVVRWRP